MQLEIADRRGEDEEGLLGFVFRFVAADYAVFDFPVVGQAIPPSQVLAVENRHESIGVGLGEFGLGLVFGAKLAKEKGEHEGGEGTHGGSLGDEKVDVERTIVVGQRVFSIDKWG